MALFSVLPASALAQDAYVANFEEGKASGSVSVINTETNKVVGSPISVGKEPEAIAITPNGKTAYVANLGSENVSVIDLETNTVVATIGVGKEPVAVAITPNGKSAYVVNTDSEDISVIDTETNKVIGPPISAGRQPWGIAITPDGKQAYVANEKGESVSVINTETNKAVGSVAEATGEHNPIPIVISPDGKTLYVGNLTSNNVSVIDTETNKVIGSPIGVGVEPWGLAISPDGKTLYVANEGDKTVSVIDTETDKVIGPPIETGSLPYVVTITPNGKTAYVANLGTDFVSVIDTETNKVSGSIEVGKEPAAIAIPPDQGPVASFSAPLAEAGVPVTFNASASSDPDGSIASYLWEFGDGSKELSASPSPSHTYATPGTYEAKLTLTDNEGCSSEFIFTGQTAYCNGSALATQTRSVSVDGGTGPASSVAVSVSPASIIANGKSTTTATAKVKDAGGNPLSGQEISFSSSDAGEKVGAVSESAAGTYVATITASTSAGSPTITATDDSVSPSLSGHVGLTQTAGAAASVAVSLSPTSIIANGASTTTATATVSDANANPVSGDSLVFSSTDAGEKVGAVTNHGNGTYSATITASMSAGPATITATDTSVSPNVSGHETLIQTGGPASSVAVSVSPASIIANGKSTTTATAKVKDAGGNPLSGQEISFSSSDAGEKVGAVSESAAGTYVATITASTSAGSPTITATDDSVSPSLSGHVGLTQTAGAAASVAVSLSPTSIIANGASTTTATATVSDANANPVSGDSLVFSSTDAGEKVGAVTNHGNGTYSATITASMSAGPATITATDTSVSPNVSGHETLIQTGGPASSVAVSVSPASIIANGKSTTTATAKVKDAGGNPLSGQEISFSSSDAGEKVGAVSESAAGTYVATITASTSAGSPTITATDDSVSPSLSGHVGLTQTAGAAASVAVSLSPTSIIANGASTTTATATVSDANANPVSGDSLVFSSTDAGEKVGAVTNHGNGTYSATITASMSAGPATITATDTSVSPNVSGHETLIQTGGPASSVAVSVSPASIIANGKSTTTATAKVKDAGGNPLSGQEISFSSSDAGEKVGAVSESAAGTYVATITASTSAGSPTITATDDSVSPSLSGHVGLTQTAGAAASVAVSLSPTSIIANGASTTTATATVSDANANPVSGDSLVFSSTDAGEKVGAVTNHGNGTYSATITASMSAGPATITATDTSVSPNVSGHETLIQTGGPASSVAVSVSPASIIANGKSTTTATAKVKDAGGNPLSGQEISFSSSDAGEKVGAVSESAAGTYVATITASTSAGSPTITATDDSVSPSLSGHVGLTQTAGAAASVAVSLSPTSIIANGASTTTATATVSDANANPVSGDSLVFSSTDAGEKVGAVTNHGNGTYSATITASMSAGPATITATDTSVSPNVSGHETLIQTGGPASSVAVSVSPASIIANGKSTTTATAKVKDAGGNPLSGQEISFSSSDAGEKVGAVSESAAGTYVATITASTSAGSPTITATDDSVSPSLSGHVGLTQTAGAAASVAVSLSPTSIIANGASTTTATATVSDANANPVSGDSLVFSSTDAGEKVGAVTNHGNGTYSATITASMSAGPATITATDTSVSPNVSGHETLIQTGGPASSVAVSVSPASIIANGKSTTTATAKVKDAGGNPLSGQEISFSSSDAGEKVGAVSESAAGTYVATITASTSAGSPTITATDDSVSPSLSGHVGLTQTAGAAASVAVSLSPTSIIANGASTTTATATVSDANANPVSGDSLVFSSTDAGEKVGAVTNHGNGTYSATITASMSAGPATITATDTSVSPNVSGHETLIQTGGPASSVAVSVSPASIIANGKSTTTATAKVKDAGGNPLSGDSLAFTSTAGGEHIGPVTNHGNGTYSATITAGTAAKPVTITATDDSVSPSLSGHVTLTQTAHKRRCALQDHGSARCASSLRKGK